MFVLRLSKDASAALASLETLRTNGEGNYAVNSIRDERFESWQHKPAILDFMHCSIHMAPIEARASVKRVA